MEEEDFISPGLMWESITDEAKILGQLQHENIVKFFGIYEKGFYVKKDGKIDMNACYSVSEICPNGDLWDYIEYSGRFTEPYCRYLFKQIISALEDMHSKGICHRDIKPANMLLNEEFQVKINDFGFATDRVGTLDTILGTPEYEAPELALERVYDGHRVDVFAAGVSLFNMFTGKPPFKVANHKKPKEYPFYNLIATRNNNYWKEFSEKYWCIKNPDEKGLFTKEFKSLIFGILEPVPDKRLTIDEINRHAWMKGPTATPEEMEREFRKRHGPMRYTRKQQEVEKLREHEFKPFNYRKKKLAQKKE